MSTEMNVEMNTAALRDFAQSSRRQLHKEVRAQLEIVLEASSMARKEASQAVNDLVARILTLGEARLQEKKKKPKTAPTENELLELGKEDFIEEMAYTWFNRLVALRYMDVRGYHSMGVVSLREAETQPEILSEAKMAYLDEALIPSANQTAIFDLLTEKVPSPDPQGEAYRKILFEVCRHYHNSMPFLFQELSDYSELLLPLDLLSEDSFLAALRGALHAGNCQDIEIIGWIYQYYISEQKDQVMKARGAISAKNIPAATQLFTPNWIVRYLVENSLGRLWLLNHPQSKLGEHMPYYIPDESPEKDFLKVKDPRELKILDPACGSGHILVYAFDLLYKIYEEEGYSPREIPENIISNNLFGIEIDGRAGGLAAFALSMKAREKDRRFFSRQVIPHIAVLEPISFGDEELASYIDALGENEVSEAIQKTLRQFQHADQVGALIRPYETDLQDFQGVLQKKNEDGKLSQDLLYSDTHKKVLKVLDYVSYLSPRYHAVIANPPYMGSKGQNAILKDFLKEEYKDSKSDLFAAFIERGFDFTPKLGYSSMVTMQSWMFLSSYEKLRESILDRSSIKCLMHMGNNVMGIAFGTAATVLMKDGDLSQRGAYCYVDYMDIGPNNVPFDFPPLNERNLAATK